MIKLVETYKTANKALLRHKARTVLTMLGVIIGVFAVVSLVSLGIGFQNYIEDQFEQLGSNVIIVAPGKIDFTGDPAESFGNNKLEEKHVDLIKDRLGNEVVAASPSVRFGATTEYKNISYYGSILGVYAEASEIFNMDLAQGRFFTELENTNKAKVAVLGSSISEELFDKTNPLGKKIKIEDNIYEVIGIGEEQGEDFDDNVYLPLDRVREDFKTAVVSSIAVKARDQNKIPQTMREVEYALLRDLEPDEFTVISTEDILESIQSILRILTAGIGAIAGISLLVGGIGIMNIMLVSVTERTSEIGLRKALGAAPKDIITQFLTESVLISVGGGSIGLFLGWLASLAGRQFVRTEVPLWAVGLAFGFSVVVGMIFGTYPAIKAGKKDAIEALRYE